MNGYSLIDLEAIQKITIADYSFLDCASLELTSIFYCFLDSFVLPSLQKFIIGNECFSALKILAISGNEMNCSLIYRSSCS